MSPISYQGPLAEDEEKKRTQSQTKEGNLGAGQPGLTVSAILAEKGDDIFTVNLGTAVKEVVAELTRLRIGALVVLDSSKAPIGIVSERDVVRHADSKGLEIFECPVADIMTADPETCGPGDKVESLMQSMTAGRFRHLPVVENGRLCGLVSIGDIVRHRMMQIEYENLKMKQVLVG